MAEFFGSLLNEMSSTFNYSEEEVKIDLNRDRTLKWRSLHHNQYASAKKKVTKSGRNDEVSSKMFRNPLAAPSGLRKIRRARIKLNRLKRKGHTKETDGDVSKGGGCSEAKIQVNYIAGDCSVNLIDIKPGTVQIFEAAPVKVERRISRRSTEKLGKSDVKEEQQLPEKRVSQRRVKPTEKILANKRLRRGFQIHNTRIKEAIQKEKEKTPPKLVTAEKDLIMKALHFEQLGLRTTTPMAEIVSKSESPGEKPPLPAEEITPPMTMCLCQEDTQFYSHTLGDVLFCNAVDQFESEFVGCCNQVDENSCIRRPSTRACFMLLCQSHLKRLMSHNCCAGCGIFCTQGKVLLCPRNHFFHRDCVPDEGSVDQVKCLHCGENTKCNEVRIELKCDNRIVFYPSQKTYQRCTKTPTITMAGSPNSTDDDSSDVEIARKVPEHIINVLIKASQQASGVLPELLNAKSLQAALKNEDMDSVAEFIVSGFDFASPTQEFGFGTCLHYIAYHGTVEMAQLLLCRFSGSEFIDMLDKEFQTAVMCAVNGNKTDILVLLLQYGAKITQKGPDGMTALHLAAKTGNMRATKILLEYYKKKVDSEMFRDFLNDVDHGNWTALVWAAELGHVNIESYLVGLGADATICDFENNTALHWAALSNKVASVLPLLQTNVNLNHQNVSGDTPLHIACRHLNTQMCLMLLANGSDVHVRNFTEKTAIGCIPDTKSQCARIMQFNVHMHSRHTVPQCEIVREDITNGREENPIAMVKILKRSTLLRCEEIIWDVPLPAFKYVTQPVLVEELVDMDTRVGRMEVCNCTDNCTTSLCKCIRKSSQKCCYTFEGRLMDDFNFTEPSIIFECSEICGCNKRICKNRVVQNGIKVSMEVFNVIGDRREWGVRTLQDIRKGTFIAEYIGELLSNTEADRREVDSYFFGFDLSEYCVDGNYFGNVSRFFNHSCSPNMIPIRVYFDHHDMRFPKIAFFTTRNIAAKEELTFDYGKNFWQVKQRYFNCCCNTPECRYRTTLPSEDPHL
ncbi:histone-lysine N-methyltransferase EHMT1 [Sergentomyia squamirostris]